MLTRRLQKKRAVSSALVSREAHEDAMRPLADLPKWHPSQAAAWRRARRQRQREDQREPFFWPMVDMAPIVAKTDGHLTTLEGALRKGVRLHGFLSGGGLRVVRLELDGQLVGYGEHPHVDAAMSLLAEDYLAGGRPYGDVYGPKKPHYRIGSPVPDSAFDASLRRGRSFDAFAEDENFVCEIDCYEQVELPAEQKSRALTEAFLWEQRGYVIQVGPCRFPDGTLGYSMSMVSCPEGKTHSTAFNFGAVRKGVASTLEAAIAAALVAEPVEIEK